MIYRSFAPQVLSNIDAWPCFRTGVFVTAPPCARKASTRRELSRWGVRASTAIRRVTSTGGGPRSKRATDMAGCIVRRGCCWGGNTGPHLHYTVLTQIMVTGCWHEFLHHRRNCVANVTTLCTGPSGKNVDVVTPPPIVGAADYRSDSAFISRTRAAFLRQYSHERDTTWADSRSVSK